jgi:molybdate transport system ATP-binding protein
MTLSVDVTARRGTFAVRASFDAGRGSTTALLGPNGSGKSTLVASMAGLVPPEEGSVVLDRVVLDEPAAGVYVAPERRPIGVVFQDLLLFPHLSALENVAFPLLARGVARAEAHDRSEHLLGRLEVTQRARAKPRDLSGGEAQSLRCCCWTNPCRRSTWARARGCARSSGTSSNASRGSGSSSRTTRWRRRRWPNGS